MSRKLNYLLIMPRLVQNIGDGYSFPLGITYISSSMKKSGYNVLTVNLNHREGDVFEIIKKIIEENKIDIVATGGLSFQYSTVKMVIEAAKRAKSAIITIVGGGIISGDPEPAMQALEYADYGVIGEGEVTINDLCQALELGEGMSKVDGIIYKKDNSFEMTKPRREMENIDSIAWPDYQGFEVEKYLRSTPPSISGLNKPNTIFMLASRSCPYNCTFCFHTTGRKYRQRSLDSFFEELDYMVSKYNIAFICLADELFARNIERVKEFCVRIKKYGVRWWAQFRVDDITPELLAILKDGKCEVMSFGLESADNRILKSMRKGTTVEQIERTLKLVYDSGISFEGAFIFGDIEETNETASNTLKWWREHSAYRITLNLITVYPGSYLYKHACEKRIIKDRTKFLSG
ncbi:MAG: radical SAM protein, partial [Candidatus Omnitrophota bacterium]|nr:radical SAM protein [Candidatus Omnitrophota bacterium]